MCSSLLMRRPGLLTVNRDSRRNVELVARRRSGTWPQLVQNIVTSGVTLARPFWRLPQVSCLTDQYSSDIQLHGKVFTRATAVRSDGPYLSMYYRRCAGYQVSVCVLRFFCVGVPIWWSHQIRRWRRTWCWLVKCWLQNSESQLA